MYPYTTPKNENRKIIGVDLVHVTMIQQPAHQIKMEVPLTILLMQE